jgi:VWFA-related protein
MRYSALCLLGAVVVLQSPILLGQAQQAPGVTFQVEVNYVDVDVVVTDEQGQFVTGLTRNDFAVFEDGKPQKIDTFSLVDLPFEKAQEIVVEGRAIPADTRTNRKPFDGRVYVIVLDDLDVSAFRSAPTRDAARRFVREHMAANDLGAVVYTSGRSDAAQEFTTDRELLIRAIDKFQGRRLRSLSLERLDAYYQRIAYGYNLRNDADPNTGSINSQDAAGYGRTSDLTELERGTRAMTVLDTLKNTAEFLGSVRGRRKAVLFFSEGLDYPIRDVFGAHDATVVIRATQDAISAAARANVNYYTIDPRGLAGMTTDFMESAGIGNGVGTTGPVLMVPGTNTPVSGVTGVSGGVFNVQAALLQEFRPEVSRRSTPTTSNPRFSASPTPIAAITCSGTIRQLIRATVDSTRSKYVSRGQVFASQRGAGMPRREAARRKSANATTQRGLRAKRAVPTGSGRRRRSSARLRVPYRKADLRSPCTRRRSSTRPPRPRSRWPSKSTESGCRMARRTRKGWWPTRSSSRFSASTNGERQCQRPGLSSISTSAPKRVTA